MIFLRDQLLLDLLVIGSRLPADDVAQYEAFTGEKYDHQRVAAQSFGLPGPHWTYAVDDAPGAPLVTGGLIRMQPGVYRSWFLSVPEAWSPENAPRVTEITLDIVTNWVQAEHAHRIETLCLASRERTRRWYTKVGLEYESTLHGYGVNGEDAVLYTALRKKVD